MADYVMNNEGEYGMYVVQELKAPQFSPGFAEFYKTYAKRLLWMDSRVVPGSFQMNTSWYMSASDCRPLLKHDEHVHDFDEMIGFLGSNPDDPYDLGAEIEIGITVPNLETAAPAVKEFVSFAASVLNVKIPD